MIDVLDSFLCSGDRGEGLLHISNTDRPPFLFGPMNSDFASRL